MIDWRAIDTVLLDMDGTLLDLHFDTYFWTEHVPRRYAEKRAVSVEAAKAELYPRIRALEGTMDWYCLDYWTRELDLDVALLKEEVDHLIAVHPFVVDFLGRLEAAGKRRVLVTNAHMKSLELKMERTRLHGYLDAIVCSHDYGSPKEDPGFWAWLGEREPYDPARSLLIDDSLPVLRSARHFGIAHLLAVYRPDTQQPERDPGEFEAIRSFNEIMP